MPCIAWPHCIAAHTCGELRLADAVNHKKLVLVDSPRTHLLERHKAGRELGVADQTLGDILGVGLPRTTGMPVDRENLSNRASERTIRDRRSDLGQLLPPRLDDLIVPAGRYCYRLNLSPNEIALFVHDENVELVEDVSVGAALVTLTSLRPPRSYGRSIGCPGAGYDGHSRDLNFYEIASL